MNETEQRRGAGASLDAFTHVPKNRRSKVFNHDVRGRAATAHRGSLRLSKSCEHSEDTSINEYVAWSADRRVRVRGLTDVVGLSEIPLRPDREISTSVSVPGAVVSSTRLQLRLPCPIHPSNRY